MTTRLFLTSLLAVSLSFQLLRLPHLILENGGGFFLILLIVAAHLIALPLLILERVLDKKLGELDLRSLIYLSKTKQSFDIDGAFVFTWFGLRFLILLGMLWYFLYLFSNSLNYLYVFGGYVLDGGHDSIDFSTLSSMGVSYTVALLSSFFIFLVSYYFKKKFFFVSAKYILPFCFLTFLVLLFKILGSVQDLDGFKILLYPDFSAINLGTLRRVIGHTLVCLMIGFGFYDVSLFKDPLKDPIELFVRAIIQTLFVSFLVGAMALPMIEKVSEIPFGTNWVFSILPRWLSYTEFGYYYNFLFFFCICFLSFFMSVLFLHLMNRNLKLLYSLINWPWARFVMHSGFVVVNAYVIVLLSKKIQGWAGQSFSMQVDAVIVDGMLPLLALLMLWFGFRYTSQSERMEAFEKQQVLFHSKVFFNIWQKTTLFIVPSIILLAWYLGGRT